MTACATQRHSFSSFSMLAGERFLPPAVMMISFLRPVILHSRRHRSRRGRRCSATHRRAPRRWRPRCGNREEVGAPDEQFPVVGERKSTPVAALPTVPNGGARAATRSRRSRSRSSRSPPSRQAGREEELQDSGAMKPRPSSPPAADRRRRPHAPEGSASAAVLLRLAARPGSRPALAAAARDLARPTAIALKSVAARGRRRTRRTASRRAAAPTAGRSAELRRARRAASRVTTEVGDRRAGGTDAASWIVGEEVSERKEEVDQVAGPKDWSAPDMSSQERR